MGATSGIRKPKQEIRNRIAKQAIRNRGSGIGNQYRQYTDEKTKIREGGNRHERFIYFSPT